MPIGKERLAHRPGIARRKEPIASVIAPQRVVDQTARISPVRSVARRAQQEVSDLVGDGAPEQGVDLGARLVREAGHPVDIDRRERPGCRACVSITEVPSGT